MENPCSHIKADEVKKVSRNTMLTLLESSDVERWRHMGYGFYRVKYKFSDEIFTYEITSGIL